MSVLRAFLLAALALLPAAGCAATASEPDDGSSPPADLPRRVSLKTATETFTHEWYVALRDGRIWIRPNEETTPGRAAEPWRPLPPDGRPRHGSLPKSGPPPALREIGADGDNLIAVGEDGLVYYAKLSRFDDGWLERRLAGGGPWIDLWGLPPRGKPLHVPPARRALAISHRGPLAGGYEDIDGNWHPVSAGVTTLYLLEADGRTLRYADPWLPGAFVRRIALPHRDRLIAVGMSASASTICVVDPAGNLFTRLADYDTLGENPVLPYTYERGFREGQAARVLPPEDWVRQPPVPGRITRRITILQTGRGNAARDLRIEGVDADGVGGYWTKALRDRDWRFVRTGTIVSGPFLNSDVFRGDDVLGPERDRDLGGLLEDPEVEIWLRDFNPICPPAWIWLLDRDLGRLDLPLHMRDIDREDPEDPTRITSADGTIIVPPDLALAGPIGRAVVRLFGKDARLVAVEVKLERDGSVVLERSLAEKLPTRPLRILFRPFPSRESGK